MRRTLVFFTSPQTHTGASVSRSGTAQSACDLIAAREVREQILDGCKPRPLQLSDARRGEPLELLERCFEIHARSLAAAQMVQIFC
jgi:hypothetical protein